jgi:hypothetical protein
MQDEIRYELSTPVPYANKGEEVEGTFVTITAPTSRNLTDMAYLKQAFFRSLPTDGAVDVDVEEDSNPEGKLTGEAIMTLITMSGEVDLGKVLLTGKELLTSGIALVEGETKLTKPLADKLSMDDLSNMVGEFMANFILASVLQKQKKG